MLKVAVRLRWFWSGCLLCLLCVVNAEAATVRLAWDPVPEADVAGYRILYGTQPGHYSGAIDVAKSTDFTITSLADGVYYFAVQAYTFKGVSSVPSNEVVAAVGTVPPLSGCATADPFASMGGGTCYNGGWLPPVMAPPSGGSTTVVSPPPATPGVCTTADPFAAGGVGTCYNGGGLPPGMTAPGGSSTPPPASTPPPSSTPPPTPPAPTAPTTCSTADPFASIGVGTCYNGGWLPPGMPVPGGATITAPPPSSSTPPPPTGPTSCSTADPFAAMGGGTCYNGGWLPPGMAIPSSGTVSPTAVVSPPPPPPSTPGVCTTGDPFASMGGGTCYNGGWLPPGMPVPGGSTITAPPPSSSTSPPPTGPTTCSTADPFAAMGGGTCHGGGWLPPGMVVPSGGTVSPTASPARPPLTNLVVGCATPDPFTAMGGGTCVNGGWLAPGMKETTGAAHMTVTGTLQVLNVTDGLWLIAGDDGIFYASHSILPAHLLIDGARVTFVGVIVTLAAPGTAAVVDILSIELAGKLNR